MTKVKLDDEVLRMAIRAAGAAGIPVRRWVEQAIRGAARPEIAQVWPAAVDDVAGSMSRQHRGYLRLVSPRAVVAADGVSDAVYMSRELLAMIPTSPPATTCGHRGREATARRVVCDRP